MIANEEKVNVTGGNDCVWNWYMSNFYFFELK